MGKMGAFGKKQRAGGYRIGEGDGCESRVEASATVFPSENRPRGFVKWPTNFPRFGRITAGIRAKADGRKSFACAMFDFHRPSLIAVVLFAGCEGWFADYSVSCFLSK